MSHFAKVTNGIVERVIVAEQDFVDQLPDSAYWIQTSYNTHGGVNYREGGTPLRKNFAAAGFSYDSVRDAFIPPKPFPSWVLDEATCLWEAPVAKPDGGYDWDEANLEWIPIQI